MINDDMHFTEDLFDELEEKPTRNGYGRGVLEAGKHNEDIVVLCCDLTGSTRSKFFKQEFPDRFVEVGVAEQNMAGLAAGMAFAGKIPYISSYAVFNPGINWSQIRVAICYSKANVKIMGAHAGISVGPDGATHQALEDIAITRVLPNMTVVVPCDFHQTKKAAQAIADVDGPCYMRFARAATPIFTTEDTPFQVGKAQTFRYGDDVTIIAAGPITYEALKAAKMLEGEGIDVRVLNMHTIKPIDEEAILSAAAETGAIVTAEEHQIHGGLGSAVSEVLSRNHPVPMESIAVRDRFGESGEPKELLEEFGLKDHDIADAVRKVLGRKGETVHASDGFERPFHFVNGDIIRTEKELLLHLKHCGDAEYWHHVNEDGNDFADWVENVLRKESLAARLREADTRGKAIELLEKDLINN